MDTTNSFASADAAAFLTLMGNEKRLAIMNNLIDAELSVGSIADKVELSQSALSQHLAKLRAFDLVQTRRDRQTIYYSCRSDAVRRLLSLIGQLFGEEEKEMPPARLRSTGT
ncbi:ArsR family transcriptional regulator [Mesorhizobium sp. Root157]|uniref:ArsR/SmtB family transcription factor n=1 Tax=Mesorhizobium sp. Root157 TaxID=1736477 RepID=UPI0006F63A64|nr:metalloregulator ArsR/SmtB family transcription factor [Mesorhizobium sp. Root157]KQZ87040.1 ArsR family transcriptional regulator [Mesorhizobium sp. Root157]